MVLVATDFTAPSLPESPRTIDVDLVMGRVRLWALAQGAEGVTYPFLKDMDPETIDQAFAALFRSIDPRIRWPRVRDATGREIERSVTLALRRAREVI